MNMEEERPCISGPDAPDDVVRKQIEKEMADKEAL